MRVWGVRGGYEFLLPARPLDICSHGGGGLGGPTALLFSVEGEALSHSLPGVFLGAQIRETGPFLTRS